MGSFYEEAMMEEEHFGPSLARRPAPRTPEEERHAARLDGEVLRVVTEAMDGQAPNELAQGFASALVRILRAPLVEIYAVPERTEGHRLVSVARCTGDGEGREVFTAEPIARALYRQARGRHVGDRGVVHRHRGVAVAEAATSAGGGRVRGYACVHRSSALTTYEEQAVLRLVGVWAWVLEQREREKDQESERRAMARASEVLRTEARSRLDYVISAVDEIRRHDNPERALAGTAEASVGEFADWAILDLVQPATNEVARVRVAHRNSGHAALATLLLGFGPPRRGSTFGAPAAIRSRRPQILEDISEEHLRDIASSAEHLEALRSVAAKSYLGLPFEMPDGSYGALSLFRCSASFDADDLHVAEGVVYWASRVRPGKNLPPRVDSGEPGDPEVKQALAKIARLPPRQSQILKLQCQRLSQRQIASRLNISLDTVKNHCNHMYKHLEVQGQAEAVQLALLSGIVQMTAADQPRRASR